MTGQEKGVKQPLACWVHTSQPPETKRRFVLFGLSLFQGILYAPLSSNRPSNHEAMEGRSRRYALATILVIDDQEPIRALLRIALEGAGHEVLEASNGRLGLALYRARAADLIITDLVMPEMDGLEMMLELTRNFLNVKVIALSAGLEGEAPLHVAKLLGARQTIQKPLDMETVLSAVRYELAH